MHLRVLTILLTASLVSGCELFETSNSSHSGALLFFGMGRIVPGGPPVAEFQRRFLPDVFIFDATNRDDPQFLCEHDDVGTLAKAEEYDIPMFDSCVEAPEGPTVLTGPFTGPVGTNPVPDGYRAWTGATNGGCGTWSAAMCNRMLRNTDPMTHVTETEWNTIAAGIRQDPETGGSFWTHESQYYQDQGYCTARVKFEGTPAEYADARAKFDMHCDLKIEYFKRVGVLYENGHVETVTSVGDASFTTNSWGHTATVSGGSAGRFMHLRDEPMVDASGNPSWPAEETDMYIAYVCPCGGLERFGQLLLDRI